MTKNELKKILEDSAFSTAFGFDQLIAQTKSDFKKLSSIPLLKILKAKVYLATPNLPFKG